MIINFKIIIIILKHIFYTYNFMLNTYIGGLVLDGFKFEYFYLILD